MISRETLMDRARSSEPWDVVVLGGGATGLGTALDSSLRGYRTLLLEARDFASGTSSRSTKLIHGGVRYLARGQISLVREALHEREILLRNAPHVVRRLPFLLPTYRPGSSLYYGFGLWLYDKLAGRTSFARSRIVSRQDALQLAPTLAADHLRGGVVYEDAQFDDSRLAISLLRTFLDAGGTALNYASVEGLERDGGGLRRVLVRDQESGREWSVTARVVVNATGVFADAIRRMDDPSSPPLIRPSRGSHLVVAKSVLPGNSAVLVPKTDDGRVLFAIPWLGRVLIGTTDVAVNSVETEPRADDDEIEYLLEHANRYLRESIDRTSILATFSGLRPLIASGARGATKTISREHALFVSESGLVTIVGGKWTTYRRMAKDAVDRAAIVAGLTPKECRTEHHRLHGARDSPDANEFSEYGSDAEGIRALIRERPELSKPIVEGLPYVEAEIVWAFRHEMARTADDILQRRTRCGFLDEVGSREAETRISEILKADGCEIRRKSGDVSHDRISKQTDR